MTRLLGCLISAAFFWGCIFGNEPEASAATDDEYARHISALRADLPRGFHLSVEKPFVVLGNQPRKIVDRLAHSTIRLTVERLKKDYFTETPTEIIDVWLFSDGKSYLKYAQELFGDAPDTPYGYYSETHNALVMNIGTGIGTLIHELVHPFMRADFPNVPTWFNEGLASLFECSAVNKGHIRGVTNWRLPGLQRAIRQKTLPSLERLTAMTASEFYGDNQGDNYAGARYLLQYLQEKELLVPYYHAFRAARETDPTGYHTLRSILGEPEMEAFERRWKRWVMRLKYAK